MVKRALIVDDDATVRRALERALERALPSLDTVFVSSGNRAIELLSRDSAFDVVLSDMNMEDGSALELHAWLASHHPRLLRRFLVMSGGAVTAEGKAFLIRMDGRVLSKPIVPSILEKKIEELLEADDGQ
jgi:CheY-like chemotaxis protein